MIGLLILFAGAALPAATRTVEVHVVDGLTGQRVAAQVNAHLAAGEGTGGPAPVTAEAPGGRASLALPAGLWTISATKQGLWGWPVKALIEAAPSTTRRVTLELWPTGRVSGQLRVPPTDTAPAAIQITPRRPSPSAAWPATGGEDASVRCPVAGATWSCDLPMGRLDLQLDLSPSMPRYLWDVAVERDRSTAVGEVRLERGGSVSGWVRGADGRPSVAATASLRIPGETPGPVLSAPTNGRGFFQIGPVPAGPYDLVATHGAHASHPVRTTVAREEERVRQPLALEPPATLQVAIDPPLDPAGATWRVSLLSVQGSSGSVVVRQASAGRDGRWTKPMLPAGPYRIAVKGSGGQVWHESALHVQPGGAPVEVSLRLDQLSGEVTIGDEPLQGTVRLANAAGGAKLTFTSDEKGHFGGPVPRMTGHDGDWSALVDSSDPTVRRALERVPFERVGESDVRVTVRLPAGTVEGVVVDEAGQPFTGPSFVFAHGLNDTSELGLVQAKLLPADGGRFRLQGLAAGGYRIHATAPGRQSGEVEVSVKESAATAGVKLVLAAESPLSGRVIGIDGTPVAGAELLVFPADSPYGLVRTIRSDAEGRFTSPLPAGTREVVLRVGALGFARRLLRRTVASGTELVVQLDPVGGTLAVGPVDPHQDDRGGLYVINDEGAFDSLGSLLRWSALQGEGPPSDGLARISSLAAGHYRVCRAAPSEYQAFITGALDRRKCTEGDLPRGGELRLTLPASEQATSNPIR
jgi:hypothetical protein